MPRGISHILNGTMDIHRDDQAEYFALVSQNMTDSKGAGVCLHHAFEAGVPDPAGPLHVEASTDQPAREACGKGGLKQVAFLDLRRLRVISGDVTASSAGGLSAFQAFHEVS